MMKMRDAMLVIAMLLVSGCAATGEKTSDVQGQPIRVTAPATPTCGNLLEYYAALKAMPAELSVLELKTLREHQTSGGSLCYELRLAVLLALQGNSSNDLQESRELLQKVLASPDGEGIKAEDRQLAQLILDLLEGSNKVQRGLHEKLSNERAASLQLLQRLAETEAKLKQLKNIDKDINAKEQSITTPSTDNIPNEPK
jgi:hypothetical protein